MADCTKTSRRDFIKTVGAAVAFPMIVGANQALAASSSPSNRIVMASIGVGGMGVNDTRAFYWNSDVQLVAVCDPDRKHAERAQALVEKHYANQKRSGLYKGCKIYTDFREVLEREDIDAVMVATPDHWHVPISLAAVKAGKDIYCEKPLSLTIREGRVLSEAVRRYTRVFQIGSQQRSDRRFRFACELVLNGRIGKLQKIYVGLPSGRETGPQPAMPVPPWFDYEMWLGQAPWAPYTAKRCHYNFRFILDYSGGQLTNWGAHHLDIAQWGNGTDHWGPVEVEGRGDFPKEGLWNTAVNFDVTYRYANGVELHCSNKNRMGVKFVGTDGWVYVTRGKIDASPKSLLTSTIGPNEIHLYVSKNHHRNFLDCVKTRRDPVAPVEVGHRTATMCHLANITMLLGRKLHWDPATESFVGDDEANRMTSRPMRSPWRL